ncbi:autotransporter outer membrane beta-barrel domain-containing protein, partial [Pseudomonas shirazensis]
GNLYVAGNSALGLTLGADTNPARAVVSVSGTAEFGEGAQLKLTARGSDFSANGSRFKLIEAGELQGAPLVTSTSALLDVDTSAVEG